MAIPNESNDLLRMCELFSPKPVTGLLVLIALGVAIVGAGADAQDDPLAPGKPIGSTRLAITVDDFPENGDLPFGVTRDQVARDLIAALRNNGALDPYGFANGGFLEWAPEEQSVLTLWLAANHPLGNHTYNHPSLSKAGVKRFIESIEKEDKFLAAIDTSSESIRRRRIFRYPFLDEGDTPEKRIAVRNYLFKNHYQIAEVTTDYSDWVWNRAYNRCLAAQDDKSVAWPIGHVGDSADRHLRGANAISEYLLKRRIPQILLIHINAFSALTIGGILKRWKDQGVSFVPLSEALSDPVYKMNPNYAGVGLTFLEQIAEWRGLAVTRFEDSTYTFKRLNSVCGPAPERGRQ